MIPWTRPIDRDEYSQSNPCHPQRIIAFGCVRSIAFGDVCSVMLKSEKEIERKKCCLVIVMFCAANTDKSKKKMDEKRNRDLRDSTIYPHP